MKNTPTTARATNTDDRLYQFDPQFGFWGAPNLVREVTFETRPNESIQVAVRHNEDGNRDVQIPSIKDKTIVCFGGSHTWGGGVSQEVRYTEHLAKSTGSRVINMGHCSFGLDQVCLAILQKSAKYNPKIIVIEQHPWAIHRVLNNYVNGYVRPYFFLDTQNTLKLQKVPYLAKYEAFRKIIGSYYSFRKEFLEFRGGINLKSGYDASIDPIFMYWKTRHYDAMYNLVDKIMCVIRDHCRQNGIKLIFALGAIKQQLGPKSKSELIDFDLPRNRLIELLGKNNIAYVDMTSSMKAAHTEIDPVMFADGHINAKGHEVFAHTLFDELQARGWNTK
ncbi:MAG: hypothetical protein WA056_07180 [Gallionella sp.]